MVRPPLWYATAITLLFGIITVAGVFHHEPWRDEIQAWLMATEANSFVQLYENCRYEGHPMLWHSLLFVISRFSDDVLYMQLFSAVVASLAVWVFCAYAPFTKLQKLLFSFGFFPLYQYCLLSRSYGLILLLSVLFMVSYSRNPKTLWNWIILFFLANTAATGLVLSCCFAGLLLFRGWPDSGKPGLKHILTINLSGLIVFAVGLLIAVWHIYPEKDHLMSARFSGRNLKIVSSSLYDAYFFISYWPILNNWSTIEIANMNWLDLVLSILLFAFFILLFSRNKAATGFYVAGTLSMILFLTSTGMYSARFIGHFYLILIIAFWLDRKEEFPIATFTSLSVRLRPERFRTVALYSILICQAIAGAVLYYTDRHRAFSSSRLVAAYLQEQHYDHLPVAGAIDYTVSPLSYWLKAPVYYPEQRSFGTYMVWTQKNKHEAGPDALVLMLDSLLQQHTRVIMVLSTALPESNKKFEQTGMPGDTIYQAEGIRVHLLRKFEGAMVRDENYYVYLANR